MLPQKGRYQKIIKIKFKSNIFSHFKLNKILFKKKNKQKKSDQKTNFVLIITFYIYRYILKIKK